jgi:hypothetical protein
MRTSHSGASRPVIGYDVEEILLKGITATLQSRDSGGSTVLDAIPVKARRQI